MSYDGWVEMPDPDGGEPIELAEIGNYTTNVAGMWRWCLSRVPGAPARLSDTDGWTCERAAAILGATVAVMNANKDRLSELNPANGWGDYDGALSYLRRCAELARQFRAVPGARLRWSV